MISYWTLKFSASTKERPFSQTNQSTEKKKLFTFLFFTIIYILKNHLLSARITNGPLCRFLIVMTNTLLLLVENRKKTRKLMIFRVYCINWKSMRNLKEGFIKLNFKERLMMRLKFLSKNLIIEKLVLFLIGMSRPFLPTMLLKEKSL